MIATASWGNTPPDPHEFASRKVLAVLAVPAEHGETIEFWIEAYLSAAVHGVRSAQVAGKISRHLGRFRDWFVEGFGHDRIAAVTAREVAGWREHLAATAVRERAGGREASSPAPPPSDGY